MVINRKIEPLSDSAIPSVGSQLSLHKDHCSFRSKKRYLSNKMDSSSGIKEFQETASPITDDCIKMKIISEPSTESEGPVIEINSDNESDDERSLEWLPYETHQKVQLMSIDTKDFTTCSSTEVTSEGGESELEKHQQLSPDSIYEIMNFLEETFSDEGLSKDSFLLKHVRRHQHGLVSLKLLAGYKEAKRLRCDWRTLSMVAKESKLLEVDVDGRKIRRKKPLPRNLLQAPTSRVLAVVDLRNDLATMDRLASTFGKYGEVSSLHLIKTKPGGGVPEELRCLSAKVPEVGYTPCAIVQYESIWGVAKAVEEFKHEFTSVYTMHNRRKPSSRSIPISMSPLRYRNAQSLCETRQELRYEWKFKSDFQRKDYSTGSEVDENEKPKRRHENVEKKYRNSMSCRSNVLSPFAQSPLNSPQVKTRRIPFDNRTRDPIGPDGTIGFKKTKNPLCEK